ncbi:efflux RND transporter periplasmic adaptor subunit [Mesorhizobium sp. SB112]|uniref:efflux RND transporter periplasmic adaptor subunit n=1 Tax=Mesorhizobium sp. SB112 TaxID=3151853 RepID=UPI0032644004
MAAWKQIVFSLVILVVAFAALVFFVPSSKDTLARLGVPGFTATAQTDGEQQQAARAASRTPVVTSDVSIATINDSLSAIGTGKAEKSVIVNPYVSGRLTEISVQPGESIEQGDLLGKLDSETEEISLDRAKLALADATAKLERTRALRTSNTASGVQLADAEIVLSNTQLALRDAELTLQRRNIVSPISGIVGILPVEAGNYVTSQTAIATIEDRSLIVVDFWVPERFVGMMRVGAPLTASPISNPGEVFEGTVSAVDNRLDDQSRTLRVQARIPNTGDRLRAGMSFQVSMKFPGDKYPSVDPLAIQWSTDGAFVWMIRDGKAKRMPVRIVQRNTESVLLAGELSNGDQVVTEGIHAVREGAEMLIANREPSASNGAAPIASSGG